MLRRVTPILEKSLRISAQSNSNRPDELPENIIPDLKSVRKLQQYEDFSVFIWNCYLRRYATVALNFNFKLGIEFSYGDTTFGENNWNDHFS